MEKIIRQRALIDKLHQFWYISGAKASQKDKRRLL